MLFKKVQTKLYGNDNFDRPPQDVIDRVLAQTKGAETATTETIETTETAAETIVPTTEVVENQTQVAPQKDVFVERFGLKEDELEERVKGYDSLKTEYEQFKSASPYKYSQTEQLEKLMEQGVDFVTASKYLSTDIDKMDELELLVADAIIKDPDAKNEEKELREYLANKYKIGEEWTEEERTFEEKSALRQALKSAKENQKTYLEETISPKRHEIQAEKESAKYGEQWDKTLPTITPDKLEFKVEGKNVALQVDKTNPIVKQSYDYLKSVLQGGATKENVDMAKEYLDNAIFISHKEQIFSQIYKAGAASTRKEDLNNLENTDKSTRPITTSNKPYWAE